MHGTLKLDLFRSTPSTKTLYLSALICYLRTVELSNNNEYGLLVCSTLYSDHVNKSI
jgi:hypothetical protein